jgi:hypothetical protein
MSSSIELKIVAPPILTGIFFLLSYGWARSFGNPLTVVQKKMLAFGTIAALGISYLTIWQYELSSLTRLPQAYLIGIAVWLVVTWFIGSRMRFSAPEDQDPDSNP